MGICVKEGRKFCTFAVIQKCLISVLVCRWLCWKVLKPPQRQWCHSYEGHSKSHIWKLHVLLMFQVFQTFCGVTTCLFFCEFAKEYYSRCGLKQHMPQQLLRDSERYMLEITSVFLASNSKENTDAVRKRALPPLCTAEVSCVLQKHRWCGQDNGWDQMSRQRAWSRFRRHCPHPSVGLLISMRCVCVWFFFFNFYNLFSAGFFFRWAT